MGTGALLLPFIFGFAQTALGSEPRRIGWSSKTYGPDGPWQAVSFGIGTPPQPVAAYPAGAWQSVLLTSQICGNPDLGSTCFGKEAGVYDINSSTTAVTTSLNVVKNGPITGTVAGDSTFTFDAITLTGVFPQPDYTVPNHSIITVERGYRTLPNGIKYAIEVGTLSLGAEDSVQVWGDITGHETVNYLADQGATPSNSYGLHIGSAALRIPGSLFFGGYDQFRVVGPVSVQARGSSDCDVDLLDVGIGVATGGSPFNFTSKSGLLAEGNSSLSPSVPVEIDGSDPYLYLPGSTCRAIAANLPVTYSPELGLYLWNTQDPQYRSIVTSPAFLGFTFRMNSSTTQNFTINVPFMLLNLTLEAPIVQQPTPYFPCSPTASKFVLGRAFLQAAFIGVNWQHNDTGPWFLAQAPGPNIASDPQVVTIAPPDAYLASSATSWVDTWKDIWTPIEVAAEQPTPTPSTPAQQPSSTGLPVGAIVGIAVAAVAVLVAAIVGVYFYTRRKAKRAAAATGRGDTTVAKAEYDNFVAQQKAAQETVRPAELAYVERPGELPWQRDPVELHGSERF